MTDHFPSERPGTRVSGAEFHLGPQICGVATAESPAQIKRLRSCRGCKCCDATGAREEQTPDFPVICGLRAFHLWKAALAVQTGSMEATRAAWLRSMTLCGPDITGKPAWRVKDGLLRGNSVRIFSVCAHTWAPDLLHPSLVGLRTRGPLQSSSIARKILTSVPLPQCPLHGACVVCEAHTLHRYEKAPFTVSLDSTLCPCL